MEMWERMGEGVVVPVVIARADGAEAEFEAFILFLRIICRWLWLCLGFHVACSVRLYYRGVLFWLERFFRRRWGRRGRSSAGIC